MCQRRPKCSFTPIRPLVCLVCLVVSKANGETRRDTDARTDGEASSDGASILSRTGVSGLAGAVQHPRITALDPGLAATARRKHWALARFLVNGESDDGGRGGIRGVGTEPAFRLRDAGRQYGGQFGVQRDRVAKPLLDQFGHTVITSQPISSTVKLCRSTQLTGHARV